ITLRVGVDDQGPPAAPRQTDGDIDCRGRLADPAFLRNEADPAHAFPPSPMLSFRRGVPGYLSPGASAGRRTPGPMDRRPAVPRAGGPAAPGYRRPDAPAARGTPGQAHPGIGGPGP